MGSLFLIVFTLMEFLWCGNVEGYNVSAITTSSGLVQKHSLLIKRQNAFPGKEVPALLLAADKCEEENSTNRELRQKIKDLKINEKVLSSAGHVYTAIGEAVPTVFGFDLGKPYKAVGAGIHAAAAAAGAAAEMIDVESRELEYTKCFKKEFDEFKEDFGSFKGKMRDEFNNTNVKLDALHAQAEKGFNETKQMLLALHNETALLMNLLVEVKEMIKDLFDEVKDQIEESNQKILMRGYNSLISDSKTLKDKFKIFLSYLGKDSKRQLLTECNCLNPIGILRKIADVFMPDILDLKSHRFYGLLKYRWGITVVDIMNLGEMASTCFAMQVNKTTAEVIDYTNTHVMPHVKKIVDQIIGKMVEVKIDLINHKTEQMLASVNVLKEHLSRVEVWGEWAWAKYLGKGAELYGVYDYFVSGEAKAYKNSAIIWCDVSSDKRRIENAERFTMWWNKSGPASFKRWVDNFKSMAILKRIKIYGHYRENIPYEEDTSCLDNSYCSGRVMLLIFIKEILSDFSTISLQQAHKIWSGIMITERANDFYDDNTGNMKFMASITSCETFHQCNHDISFCCYEAYICF